MMNELLTIKKILTSGRFNLGDEKRIQGEIADRFAGLPGYQREVTLAPGSIIDFLIGDIGIEIKIKGSAKAIYRQLERYCASDEVKTIVLVTNKIMKLPAIINQKETHIINLGNAWL